MILIVGAGPVGIYLTKKFLDFGEKVTLIEAGFVDRESALLTRDNYEFLYPSQMPKGVHKVGGGSNFWHARFGEYVDIDFERDWLGGKFIWPIDKTSLQPHYDNVAKFFGEKIHSDSKFIESFYMKERSILGENLELRLWRFAKPKIFLETFSSFQNNPNFTFLGGHKVENFREENKSCVLQILLSDDKSIEIQGDYVILACGAIAATALVASNSTMSVSKNAGRYLMEHIELFIGKIRLSNSQIENLGALILNKENCSPDGKSGVGIRLSSRIQIEKKLPQLHLELRPYYFFDRDPDTNSFIQSLKHKISYLLMKMYEKFLRLLGLHTYGIWMKSEEIPTLQSQIISNTTKFVYKREVSQDSKFKSLESIKLLCDLIEKALNISIILRKDLNSRINYGKFINWHPMNTLRMTLNSDYSVVDQNLKLNNYSYVYICSSSVFPTGSNANPTYTSLAFADRLANKLIESIHSPIS